MKSLAKKEGFSIKNLYYNYVSPDQIQSLNNEFLKHDYVTDVLAFDYCEGSELSAEVFICQSEVEKMQKNCLKALKMKHLGFCVTHFSLVWL
ncbi:MAG: hypothetical protein CM15mP121_3460 [Bacteroidota bacterium]|nr:MAG: hypothetical protein CM15mP121_3460 [Bacteroidota bacterium]